MQDQLNLLKRLQEIDQAIKKIQDIKSAYPLKLKQLDKEFERRQQNLEREKSVIEENQKERRRLEIDFEKQNERIQKSQEKILAVKTNKEYQAVLKEIDELKQSSSDRETKIISYMEEADSLANILKKREDQFDKWVQGVDAQKKTFQSEINMADRALEEEQRLRAETLKEISPEWIKRYEIIAEKRQGLAVVSIQDGLCHGCNMQIPPQKLLEIRKNKNEIMHCPFCNRIVYWEDCSQT